MDRKHKLLTAISRRLDLPAEVLSGDPCVELKGRCELTVIRHRGIVGYDPNCILLGTALGVLQVAGRGLRVHRMNRERVVLYGEIDAVRYPEGRE